ncbi:ATP synthase [Desulfotruncus alcoholivorax]|uniref:ATP synthase n=1 Tax=Desulfotruncus alcoholivorax TaxID=265477 RepID=UPI0004290217|nr:ATP synthase [Desulfotruncus alcoholivorax]
MGAIDPRVVEAYIGEYASGKSEVAVNRALDLATGGRKVVLVDLDIVEPCYTLRPIKKELEAKGITVLAWETRDTVGLGETGNVLRAENRWALRRSGDIILDVGYGVEGAKTLNLLEGSGADPDLKIFAVINIARPMTSTVNEIVQYVRDLGKVHGLINNSHLGDDTDLEIVLEGARVVGVAAEKLGLPVVATTAVDEIAALIGPVDSAGNPVRKLVRYMPRTLW